MAIRGMAVRSMHFKMNGFLWYVPSCLCGSSIVEENEAGDKCAAAKMIRHD